LSDTHRQRLLVRYKDLEAHGLCTSRQDLSNKIRHAGFPRGFMLSANTRTWLWAEVLAWVDARPVDHPKPAQPWKAAKAARRRA
jgi:predicted DNA-binding transcriptional regulator AlpA